VTLADEDNHPVSSFLSVPGIDYNIIFKIIKKILIHAFSSYILFQFSSATVSLKEGNAGSTAVLKKPKF